MSKVFLNKFEISVCFIVYFTFISYGFISIFSIRDRILAISNHQFEDGWKILNRRRDDSNDELENFKSFLYRNAFWYVLHLMFSQIFRRIDRQIVPVAHAAVGILFIVFSYRIESICLIAAKVLSFYFCIRSTESKAVIWTLASFWMVVINLLQNSDYLYEKMDYHEFYELLIILAWCALKCLSFCLSRPRDSFRNYISYTLYFPTLVFGPFMIYERYLQVLEDDSKRERNRTRNLVKDLSKVLLWFLVTEAALHYIYVHYMENDINAVKLLSNSFGLYGFGYFMGQFFHLHYVITYGLGIALSKFEGLNAPNPPKCIGRVHFYSDMWKHFDQGLYEFLFKHIYSALCKKHSSATRKSLAIIATFSFVYVWHGYFLYILIWTVLNLLCLTLERLFKMAIHSQWYQRTFAAKLSVPNQDRLYAVLGTQIFIPSAISNFYFFSGREIGNHFMASTYGNGPVHYICLTFCCYCIFQCSEAVQRWERTHL